MPYVVQLHRWFKTLGRLRKGRILDTKNYQSLSLTAFLLIGPDPSVRLKKQ